MAHATLSPSSAYRWFACPGSVGMSKDIADESSEAAREGTFAHAIAERALVEGRSASDFIGQTDGEFTVDADMAKNVQIYLDILFEHDFIADEVMVEQRAVVNDNLWGTADYVAVIGQELHVFDFKYGRSRVDAQENKQMMIYAAALRATPPTPEFERQFTDVVLHIVQPRVEPSGLEDYATVGRHDVWKMPVRALDAWVADVLEPAVAEALKPQARLQSGDHCTFCPAKAQCPALRERALEVAQEVFPSGDLDTPVAPPQPNTLNPARLQAVLEAAPLVRKWLDAVEQFATAEAKAGRTPDGYKLVATIGNRRWIDEHEARAALRALNVDPTVATTISPAQAQKALGGAKHKPFIDGMCKRPVTGEKLVPVSDRRPALPGADVFSEGQQQ